MGVDILASKDDQITFPAAPAKEGIKKMPELKGNEEYPVPCKRFLAALENTPDHVWAHWINRVHGRENHKVSEWGTILEAHKNGTHGQK